MSYRFRMRYTFNDSGRGSAVATSLFDALIKARVPFVALRSGRVTSVLVEIVEVTSGDMKVIESFTSSEQLEQAIEREL
jgi:hypothetical protein